MGVVGLRRKIEEANIAYTHCNTIEQTNGGLRIFGNFFNTDIFPPRPGIVSK